MQKPIKEILSIPLSTYPVTVKIEVMMKDFKVYHNKLVFRISVAYSEAQSSREFFVKQMGHRWVMAPPQPTLHRHVQPCISYSYSVRP